MRYPVKVQTIKSKNQKERYCVYIPVPVATALGIESGEEVEWKIVSRDQLLLCRAKQPSPVQKPQPGRK